MPGVARHGSTKCLLLKGFIWTCAYETHHFCKTFLTDCPSWIFRVQTDSYKCLIFRFKVQVALVICKLFICHFTTLHLKNTLSSPICGCTYFFLNFGPFLSMTKKNCTVYCTVFCIKLVVKLRKECQIFQNCLSLFIFIFQ